jgi:hypothetical protein
VFQIPGNDESIPGAAFVFSSLYLDFHPSMQKYEEFRFRVSVRMINMTRRICDVDRIKPLGPNLFG